MDLSLSKTKFIALISDEDSVTGFLLGGIGNLSRDGSTNFLVVNSTTTNKEIEEKFCSFLNRKDIAIILITQSIAERIRVLVDNHTDPIPAILEIPSKEAPYDPQKDSILRRAQTIFGSDGI
ncbi:hypothetical protein SNEBB_006632 [Seison nebaliae]|nr:hypothetical protein SNEBB_006632 [Seison nebaliae]